MMLKAAHQEKRPCSRQQITRIVKIALICVAALAANRLFTTSLYFVGLPLFMDTVFTVAVTFAAGLIPGLTVALLGWVADGFQNAYFHPFVFVAVAEVLLVHRLKPVPSPQPAPFVSHDPTFVADMKVAAKINTGARLALLYLVCVITLSVLGGITSFMVYTVGGREQFFFSTIDTFKTGLLQSGSGVLAADILSRIFVNTADRFIVIFGGYFVSLGIRRLLKG